MPRQFIFPVVREVLPPVSAERPSQRALVAASLLACPEKPSER